MTYKELILTWPLIEGKFITIKCGKFQPIEHIYCQSKQGFGPSTAAIIDGKGKKHYIKWISKIFFDEE